MNNLWKELDDKQSETIAGGVGRTPNTGKNNTGNVGAWAALTNIFTGPVDVPSYNRPSTPNGNNAPERVTKPGDFRP